MKTHYEILGVEHDAAHQAVKSAYHVAARKWHPDNHSDSSPAEVARAEVSMREANEAWGVLGDKKKRRDYDLTLRQPTVMTPDEAKPYVTEDGVIRIDPRLLNRDYLQERRDADGQELSNAHSTVLRAFPLVGVLGALVLIFILSAYAGTDEGPDAEPTGPPLGNGIEVGDCIRISEGPSLIGQECSATSDGRIVGSRRLESGECPIEETKELVLPNGIVACIGPLLNE